MDRLHFDTIIQPQENWLDIDFKQIWKYRSLVAMFVLRNFVLQFKQTILGPLWIIINPLLTSIMFTLVFGQFAGLSTGDVPQFLFYIVGSTVWALFSNSVNNTANTFLANAHILGKVYFPRLVIPISQTITGILNFFIQFIVVFFIWFYFLLTGAAVSFQFSFFLIIPLILQSALLGLGIGIIVSSVTLKYRDLTYLVGFGLQLWMYATPIVYTLSSTGGLMRNILLWNPMTAIIENFRFALFGHGEFLGVWWIVSLLETALVLFLGIALFNRSEKNFTDIV